MRAFRKMTSLSGKSFLKDAFDKWKNFTYHSGNQEYKEGWLNKQEDIEGVEKNIEQLNDKLYSNGEMIIERLQGMLQGSPFDFLKKVDPAHLLNFIQNEHPQTVALILAYLEYDQSAAIMSALPPE